MPLLSRYLRYTVYVLLLAYIKGADCALEETQIKALKAGVLVYKDRQTSCALAPIDSKAALVAANCLDEQIVETAHDEYSVYFDDGIDGKAASYNVESITIHPEYDSITLANNIAVLQYNSNSTSIEWQNKVVISDPDMIYTYFIRFTLDDVEPMTWAQYSYIKFGDGDRASCSSMSPLSAKNLDGFYCMSQVMDSPNTKLSKCSLPYSLLYDSFKAGGMMYIAGLYSFSALTGGSSLCSYSQHRSYYTLIGFYQEYLKQVLNRDISWKLEDYLRQRIIDYSKDPNFSLNNTSEAVSSGNFLLTGDLYINQTTDDALSDSAGNDSKNSDEASQDTSASDSTDNIGQSGSSNIAGIIAGACIGAIGVVAICGAIYYVRWKRKKSPGVADPMRNNDFQDMLEASRPGQTTVGEYDIHTIADYDLPPVYEEVPNHPHPSDINRQR